MSSFSVSTTACRQRITSLTPARMATGLLRAGRRAGRCIAAPGRASTIAEYGSAIAEHDWIRLGLLHAPPATGSPLQRCRSLLRDVVTVAASTGTGTLWRGQASIDWRLVPSIARRKLPAENRSQAVLDWTSKTLAEAEAAAGRWRDGIHYRGLHPIEKLAHLRHHGVPSPLIDVTPDPFVALWFASDLRPDKSGILIGLNTHREQVSELRAVVDSYLCWRQLEGRPARNESVAGLGWALRSAEQESRIYAMDPPVLNDRIVVQRSRFLLSWFPPANTWHDGIADIWIPSLPPGWTKTKLAASFIERGRGRPARLPIFAVKIPRILKRHVRNILASHFGIDRASLFPDVGGLTID